MQTLEGDLPGLSKRRRYHKWSFMICRLQFHSPPFSVRGVQGVVESLLALHLSAWRLTMSNGLYEDASLEMS